MIVMLRFYDVAVACFSPLYHEVTAPGSAPCGRGGRVAGQHFGPPLVSPCRHCIPGVPLLVCTSPLFYRPRSPPPVQTRRAGLSFPLRYPFTFITLPQPKLSPLPFIYFGTSFITYLKRFEPACMELSRNPSTSPFPPSAANHSARRMRTGSARENRPLCGARV